MRREREGGQSVVVPVPVDGDAARQCNGKQLLERGVGEAGEEDGWG
jgi:hypothetical protein